MLLAVIRPLPGERSLWITLRLKVWARSLLVSVWLEQHFAMKFSCSKCSLWSFTRSHEVFKFDRFRIILDSLCFCSVRVGPNECPVQDLGRFSRIVVNDDDLKSLSLLAFRIPRRPWVEVKRESSSPSAHWSRKYCWEFFEYTGECGEKSISDFYF